MTGNLNRANDGERLTRLEVRADFTAAIMKEIKETLDAIREDLAEVKSKVDAMEARAKGGWWMLCVLGTAVVGLSAVLSHIYDLVAHR